MQVADAQWRRMQFLYTDEEGVHVMDKESFEQFCVPRNASSGVLDWLQDDLEVSALMHAGVPVVLGMPSSQITVQVPRLPRPTLVPRLHPASACGLSVGTPCSACWALRRIECSNCKIP